MIVIFKILNLFRGDLCDYSPRVPGNLATSPHTYTHIHRERERERERDTHTNICLCVCVCVSIFSTYTHIQGILKTL